MRRTSGALPAGRILLLHDADGSGDGDDRSQTAEAVPEIVERAHAAGYELVTVSELATRAPARRTATWRIIAGLVLFAILVELALRSVDIGTVSEIDVAWWWVIAAFGLNLASILLKAVVWKAALDTIPDQPRFQYAHVVPALFIGFLLNTLLPARLGEIGRVAVLRRRLKLVGTDVPNATLAGSLVAEQIVLAIALVLIMLLQLPFVNVPARFENMILAFGGVVIVLLLAVIGLEACRARAAARCAPDYAFTRGQQALAMLHPIARGMQQGQTVLRRPRTAPGRCSPASRPGRRRSAASTRRSRPPTSTRRSAPRASSSSSRRSSSCSRSGPATSASSRPRSPRCSSRPTRSTSPTRIAFAVGLQVIEVALGVGLGFWFLSREGLSLSEVRGLRDGRLAPRRADRRAAGWESRARRRAGTAFRGGHVPPRGGGSPAYQSRYAEAMARFPTTSRGRNAPRARRFDSRARRSALARRRRPPPARPAQAAPKPRAVVTTAQVPFRWHKAKRAQGYDLRVARDRGFTRRCRRCACAAPGAAAAAARALVLEGALDGQGQLALVEHPAGHRAADRATPTRRRARPRCA